MYSGECYDSRKWLVIHRSSSSRPLSIYVIPCTCSRTRDDDGDHDEYYERDLVNIIYIIYIRALLPFPIRSSSDLVTVSGLFLKGFPFIEVDIDKTKRLRYKKLPN